MYKRFGKRFIDFWGSLVLLLLFSPVILVVTIVLWFKNDGNPFFYQKRPGKDEVIFSIIKFKTMTDRTDENGKLLPDVERLTPTGAFLRKTSLDELPQLFNVLKGEMSFVGPRPLLIKYLPYYTEKERLRHSVNPGITGLAQVSGRNFVPWNERLQLDVNYAKNLSLLNDIKIILLTIKNVIQRKDIEIIPESTMMDLDSYRKSGSLNYFVSKSNYSP
ncbi:sugar transferase [Robertkochia marina]|uniref:Sugar transferase n=1 Tax=Robertkochia marina TaxID=1227945 RepID=A0A4S3M142_9FLAO|nr:sugar transferase [Robertkochia marina]THD66767.1 sugar transferase [Robertkochia marina]TRZ42400.1 sugar transferase [Robertkochia marina]